MNRFAIIALGSNLGDARGNVIRALERLQELSREPLLNSSLWETTPVDCPPGSSNFTNAAAALVPLSGETPESLLRKLQVLEKEFGRKPKSVLNESRPLDLDLIVFLEERHEGAILTLPHPRAHQRRFVLEPLNEIAPGLVIPGQIETVATLLDRLPPDPAMKRLPPDVRRL
jgi:2-amino-4-hydroxy-6-hydroxymethyldihydropteridine diphosphokinase